MGMTLIIFADLNIAHCVYMRVCLRECVCVSLSLSFPPSLVLSLSLSLSLSLFHPPLFSLSLSLSPVITYRCCFCRQRLIGQEV